MKHLINQGDRVIQNPASEMSIYQIMVFKSHQADVVYVSQAITNLS